MMTKTIKILKSNEKQIYKLIYFKRWKTEKTAKPYKNETKVVYVPKGNVE